MHFYFFSVFYLWLVIPFEVDLRKAQVYRLHQGVVLTQVPETIVIQLRDQILELYRLEIGSIPCHRRSRIVLFRRCHLLPLCTSKYSRMDECHPHTKHYVNQWTYVNNKHMAIHGCVEVHNRIC